MANPIASAMRLLSSATWAPVYMPVHQVLPGCRRSESLGPFTCAYVFATCDNSWHATPHLYSLRAHPECKLSRHVTPRFARPCRTCHFRSIEPLRQGGVVCPSQTESRHSVPAASSIFLHRCATNAAGRAAQGCTGARAFIWLSERHINAVGMNQNILTSGSKFTDADIDGI